jgi:integrase
MRRLSRLRGRALRKYNPFVTVTLYGKILRRAALEAFPPPDDVKQDRRLLKEWYRDHVWSPNRLRHNFATHVRDVGTTDDAQELLGHSKIATTLRYAEPSLDKLARIMNRVG